MDGIGWMHENGIDVGGAPRIWNRLVEEHAASGKQSGFSLLATHPTPKERLSYLTDASQSMVEASAPSEDVLGSSTILKLVARYRSDWIMDELHVQPPLQFAAIVHRQIKMGLTPGLGRYLEARAWTLNAKRARGKPKRQALENAHVAFQLGAASESGMPSEAYRDWAKVSLQRGDDDTARTNYETYLSLEPDAWDSDFIREQLKGI